jgi:hypothetical protein
MKTFLCLCTSAALAAGRAAFGADAAAGGYVAHEWGTFTSVQDAQGGLLAWKPLASSRLPGFVYDWQHPGLGRVPRDPFYSGPKSFIMSLQRLETPVIYFYADRDLTVDARVDFPMGAITEWYPQAAQVGPDTNAVLPRNSICWSNVQVLAMANDGAFPIDASGSHYFAARETDALPLDVASGAPGETEHEKFLFYRGVGTFATPLHVSMPGNRSVALTNTGSATLRHLFILTVKAGRGAFVPLDELNPGESRAINLPPEVDALPPGPLAQKLGDQMAGALTGEGLYPREAAAMVKTWKDSWFAEDGVRVLYALPRDWTDGILPMNLNPPPRELVRVMIGRAEVLTPDAEARLADLVTRVNQGDTAAIGETHASLATLGRFADVALLRAMARASVTEPAREKLLALLPYPEPPPGQVP